MRSVGLLLLAALASCGHDDATETTQQHATNMTVRVGVLGLLTEAGLWQAVAQRFEQATGNHVQLVVQGPRNKVLRQFRKGGVDLVTVQSSDGMINLVADGLAKDPQPWARYDLVWIGPAGDPAGIKGDADAADAMKKIVAAHQPLLVHGSYGADVLLEELREKAEVTWDMQTTSFFHEDKQVPVVERTAALQAYTLMGRVPMLDGTVKGAGIAVLAGGDPLLRRPLLVETSTSANPAAADFVAFLRSRATQEWIGSFGKGKYDPEPFFYPISAN